MKEYTPRPGEALFYDIETCLLLPYLFGLGKQVVRHGQLLGGYFARTHIISITYKWEFQKDPVFLHWGSSEEDEKKMIETFDKEVVKADRVIGKNNKRFDDKHINTARMWFDLPGRPEWIKTNDDLESQLRKYFYVPSYSLDYMSDRLGLGGKIKMDFSDWEDLANYRMYQLAPDDKTLLEALTGYSKTQVIKQGKAALNKIKEYNPKDVTDTQAIWDYCKKHFEQKQNMAKILDKPDVCKGCGSSNIRDNGSVGTGNKRYKKFRCGNCNSYAGCRSLLKSGNLSGVR